MLGKEELLVVLQRKMERRRALTGRGEKNVVSIDLDPRSDGDVVAGTQQRVRHDERRPWTRAGRADSRRRSRISVWCRGGRVRAWKRCVRPRWLQARDVGEAFCWLSRTGLIGIGRCRVEDGAVEGALLFLPAVQFVVKSVARVQHALAAVDENFEIQFQVDWARRNSCCCRHLRQRPRDSLPQKWPCFGRVPKMRKCPPEFLAGCDRLRYGGRRQFEWPGNS